MRAKFFKAIAAIVLSTSVLLSADQFSGEKGDLWTGGSLNFMSLSASGSSSSIGMLMLSPMLRFFPATGFCLGPKLSWTGIYQSDMSENMFGLGAEIGYARGISTIPYFITSPHFEFINESQTVSPGNYGSSSRSSSSQAFFLPFSAGLIVPMGRGLGMQFEAGYSIGFNLGSGSSQTLNILSIGMGICGLGNTVAVSIVNMFDLLTSVF